MGRLLYCLCLALGVLCISCDGLHQVPVQDPSDTKQLARLVEGHFRASDGMSFEVVVTHQQKRPDGSMVPLDRQTRALVAMGPGTLNCRLFEGDEMVAVVNCDGRQVTEYNALVNAWTHYAQPPPSEGGDLLLDEKVNACAIGSSLRSWLPITPHGELPRGSKDFLQAIAAGRYVGQDSVDGQECYVVISPREDGALPSHTFYITPAGQIIQWVTTAPALLGDSEIVAVRTRAYRNLTNGPVDAKQFDYRAPEQGEYKSPEQIHEVALRR
jgi:hypothetical protein